MSSSFQQQRKFLTRTRLDRASGFTLIEVLTVVAIIAILFGIAMPQYREYVRRSASAEGPAGLSDARVRMEQYFLDNRSYGCGVAAMPYGPGQSSTNGGMALKNFTFSCQVPNPNTPGTAASYLLTVTGSGQVLGQIYTLDQNNNKVTTLFNASGHTVPASCWLVTGSEC